VLNDCAVDSEFEAGLAACWSRLGDEGFENGVLVANC
jgi:hypothetical protein